MKRSVTMAMLAKELGLSESAVSKALNDYPDIGSETKKLVREKAEEIGYTPNILARNLAKKTSNFVGVVIRDLASIYGEMFKSLSAAAAQYGLNLILYDTGNDRTTERECIRNLINTMAMGIVVVPVSEDIERIRRMTRGRVPVVYLGSKVRDDSVNYVSADGAAGTELAMQHLISQGHRKIVMLCDHKFSSSRSHKMAAYRAAMQAIGFCRLGQRMPREDPRHLHPCVPRPVHAEHADHADRGRAERLWRAGLRDLQRREFRR